MSKQCRILVGEDDFEDQLILEEYFKENGFNDHVAFAKNGKQVIQYLENNRELPSLIILDLNMPILNGTQTLFELKNSPRYCKIPVIIYSTSNNEDERRKCLSFGAVDYLVKPLSVDDGHAMVKRFLEFV
jgi:CheY-like chemotaxis protein